MLYIIILVFITFETFSNVSPYINEGYIDKNSDIKDIGFNKKQINNYLDNNKSDENKEDNKSLENDISDFIDRSSNNSKCSESADEQSKNDNLLNEQKTDEIIEEKNDKYSTLNESNKKSKRINILVLGVEKDPRTDSILFVSFEPKAKKLDIISIPRDTYYWEKGYNLPGQRKINAKYGRSIKYGKDIAAKGTVNAVEKLLKVQIHNYVTVSYKGVEDIVDYIGGVKINVPFNMRYTDLSDNPPLIINIPKGKQILNGKQSVKFLRWRKNNNNIGYPDGDLGRIKAQQDFIIAAIKKSFGKKLPSIIKKSFDTVNTDLSKKDAVYYAIKAIGIKTDNISTYILPGESKFKKIQNQKLSYFFYDEKETKELLNKIYRVK